MPSPRGRAPSPATATRSTPAPLTRKSNPRGRSSDAADQERRVGQVGRAGQAGESPRAPVALVLLAALTASCGAHLTKLPSPAGEPASDMAAATAQAMSACRAVASLTAEIAVSGSVGGRRLRARLLGGFTTPSVRLEAIAPAGPPFFIFVATGRDATLLLPRDERVLEHGEPAAVLEAIAGIPLESS